MIGETFGNYKVIAPLGSGGMCAVYLAEHQRIDRQVAIKILLPELTADAEAVQRFLLEARATSRIKHPGIIDILDCDVDHDGRAFIVMELLEGQTLADHLQITGPLDCDVALSLAQQIANALAAAHDEKIIHRDLKPDNVFLTPAFEDDASYAVKVLDFGIAKLIDEGSASRTRTGQVVGSPPYMSPEQCKGASAIDQRSDIYSLGCILFEMICGQPPFLWRGAGELIVAHIVQPPPRPSSLAPLIPAAVETLLDGMMAKAPADRLPSMHEVEARIAAIRSQGTGRHGCPPSDQLKRGRWHRRVALLAAMVAGVVAIATIAAGRHFRVTRRQPAMTAVPAPVPADGPRPPVRTTVIDEVEQAHQRPQPAPSPQLPEGGRPAAQSSKHLTRRRAPSPAPQSPYDEAFDLMPFGSAETRSR